MKSILWVVLHLRTQLRIILGKGLKVIFFSKYDFEDILVFVTERKIFVNCFLILFTALYSICVFIVNVFGMFYDVARNWPITAIFRLLINVSSMICLLSIIEQPIYMQKSLGLSHGLNWLYYHVFYFQFILIFINNNGSK